MASMYQIAEPGDGPIWKIDPRSAARSKRRFASAAWKLRQREPQVPWLLRRDCECPREELGVGWRAVLHFALVPRCWPRIGPSFSAEKLDAGAWLSGSAGYFASPGIAFAIELPRAIFGYAGIKPGGRPQPAPAFLSAVPVKRTGRSAAKLLLTIALPI